MTGRIRLSSNRHVLVDSAGRPSAWRARGAGRGLRRPTAGRRGSTGGSTTGRRRPATGGGYAPPGGYGPPGRAATARRVRVAMARRPAGPPGKPITGSAATMAMHAMTIDPKTGLPRGEKAPASTAAVVALVCGILLCLGPVHRHPGDCRRCARPQSCARVPAHRGRQRHGHGWPGARRAQRRAVPDCDCAGRARNS